MGVDLERLAVDATRLPTLPSAALNLIELANDPEPEVQAVADVIMQDPALVAKVLRFVNSALYSPRKSIETVRRAIVVMGLNATLNIALSFSLVNTLSKQKALGLDYLLFWRRSLLAATAAKVLAEEDGQIDAEEAVLAALLQDIGMLAIDQSIPDFYTELGEGQHIHESVCQYEKARLDADHSIIGAALLRKWNLAKRTVAAVEMSHKSSRLQHESQDRFTRCCILGGEIADELLAEKGSTDETLAKHIREQLGWPVARVEHALERLQSVLPEVRGFFELPVFDDEVIEELLQRARKLISGRNTDGAGDRRARASQLLQTRTEDITARKQLDRDPLTHVYSRSAFELLVDASFVEALKNREVVSLIFVRLNDFFSVQSLLGVSVAERVLKAAAEVLIHNTRERDVVARYEEALFAMVLPGADSLAAFSVAQRVTRSLRHELGRLKVDDVLSVAHGISVVTHGDGLNFDAVDAFVAAGSEAVYRAKFRVERNSAPPIERVTSLQ